MNQTLAALVALQALDTAADQARRKLAEIPAAEQAIEAKIAAAAAAVDAAKAALQAGQNARRQLEKEVAVVDGRLARFDEHKAAVKTNQEYTALLHEIAAAKTEKDGIEERILILMEEADALSATLATSEATLAAAKKAADSDTRAIAASRGILEGELARLAAERAVAAPAVPAALLARYEQLVKQRRGVAVAPMSGETCMACHVRLRPAISQQVRRNDEIVQCDSCQRILYFVPPAPAAGSTPASPATVADGSSGAQ